MTPLRVLLVTVSVVLPIGLLGWAGWVSIERDRRLQREELAAGYRALAAERARALSGMVGRLRAEQVAVIEAALAAHGPEGGEHAALTAALRRGARWQRLLVGADGRWLYPETRAVAAQAELRERGRWPAAGDSRAAGSRRSLRAFERGRQLSVRAPMEAAAIFEEVGLGAETRTYVAVAALLEAADCWWRAERDGRARDRLLDAIERCLKRRDELPRADSASYLIERADVAASALAPPSEAQARRRTALRELAAAQAREDQLRAARPLLTGELEALRRGGPAVRRVSLAGRVMLLERRSGAVVGLMVDVAALAAEQRQPAAERAELRLLPSHAPAAQSGFASAPVAALPGWSVIAAPAGGVGAEGALARSAWIQLALLASAALLAGLGGLFLLAAYRRAEAASQAKSAFIARASHELRTPLTLIRGVAETMQLGRADADKQQRYLATMLRETDALGALIEQVLDYADAERGELIGHPAEPVELRALAGEVAASVSDGAGVEIALRDGAPLTCALELTAVRLALLNLLINATRYGEGPVEVAVRAHGAGARLVVADRGPGLAPGEAEQIFAPFVRGSAATAGRRGAGLGLALVREVARRHHGRAYARPREGGGAEFVLELQPTE